MQSTESADDVPIVVCLNHSHAQRLSVPLILPKLQAKSCTSRASSTQFLDLSVSMGSMIMIRLREVSTITGSSVSAGILNIFAT